MSGFLASLTFMEGIFLFCGSIGSIFFILRFISLLMGFSSGSSDAVGANDASGSLLQDLDGNGVPDLLESDGLSSVDSLPDLDGDGIPDSFETGDLSDATSTPELDGDVEIDSVGTHADTAENTLTEVISSDEIHIKKGSKQIEFSVQNSCAFLMVFGLMGLGLTKYSGINTFIASTVAFISGTITAFIFTKITQAVMKMSSTGNKKISSALGKIGTVYLRIPVEGTGQIQITVSGRLEICDAESFDKVEIPYGEKVQVVRIKKGNILCVTRKINKALAANS